VAWELGGQTRIVAASEPAPMAQPTPAVRERTDPEVSARDDLRTPAQVETCYSPAEPGRAVARDEVLR
jgi:hypothetical protein